MKTTACHLALFAIAITSAPCFAEKNADLKPALAKPGKVQFEDSFDSAALNSKWEVKKGGWLVKDGAMSGSMKKEEQHAGVMFLNLPNHDGIIRFSFQLAGGKGFSLSYNTAKGHLFRIAVSPEGFAIDKDKDKKDAKSKTEELAKAEGKIDARAWHTMLVEVKGSKVTVQTDTGLKAEASHAAIDADKTGYRFVTGGSVQIDDVKVWSSE